MRIPLLLIALLFLLVGPAHGASVTLSGAQSLESLSATGSSWEDGQAPTNVTMPDGLSASFNVREKTDTPGEYEHQMVLTCQSMWQGNQSGVAGIWSWSANVSAIPDRPYIIEQGFAYSDMGNAYPYQTTHNRDAPGRQGSIAEDGEGQTHFVFKFHGYQSNTNPHTWKPIGGLRWKTYPNNYNPNPDPDPQQFTTGNGPLFYFTGYGQTNDKYEDSQSIQWEVEQFSGPDDGLFTDVKVALASYPGEAGEASSPLPSPQLTFTMGFDAWSRSGQYTKVKLNYFDSDGLTNTAYANIFVNRVNDPPHFEQPGPFTVSVPRHPLPNGGYASSTPRTFTFNSFLPYLTPGGKYGDPWEEVHPVGSDPTQTAPEDQIVSVKIRRIGADGSASDPATNVTTTTISGDSSTPAPQMGRVSASVSLGSLSDDTLTGGKRVQANLVVTVDPKDVLPPPAQFEVTVKDKDGAEFTNSFTVIVASEDATAPVTPPSLSYILKLERTPVFLNKVVGTYPTAARNASTPGAIPWRAHTHSTSGNAIIYLRDSLNYGAKRAYDAFFEAIDPTLTEPVFPDLAVVYSLPSTVDDDAVWRRDNNSQWRGFTVPITWPDITGAAFKVVDCTSSSRPNSGRDDFAISPEVFATTAASRTLGIRFKLKPGLSLNLETSEQPTYDVKVNFDPSMSTVYNIPSTPISIPFKLTEVLMADERPVNRAHGIEAVRGTNAALPFPTPLPEPPPETDPSQTALPYDAQALFLLPKDLRHYWTSNAQDSWLGDGTQGFQYPPLALIVTPVDTGPLTGVTVLGDGKATVSADTVAQVFRPHRYRLQEVLPNGSTAPLRPFRYWSQSAFEFNAPAPGTGITVLDPVGRPFTTSIQGITGSESGQLRSALDAAYGSARLAELAKARISSMQASEWSWSKYKHATNWRLKADIQHTAGASVTVGSVTLVNRNGDVSRTIPAEQVKVGALETILGISNSLIRPTGTGTSWALVPLGTAAQWSLGPAERNILWVPANQPGTESQPKCLPIVRRAGNWLAMWRDPSYAYSYLDNMSLLSNAGQTSVDTHGSCMLIRPSDELYVALLLSTGTSSSVTQNTDYQWTAADTAARFDLVDETAATMTKDLERITSGSNRTQPIKVYAKSDVTAIVPYEAVWSRDGAPQTTVAINFESALKQPPGGGSTRLFNYDIGTPSERGITAELTLQPADVLADQIRITRASAPSTPEVYFVQRTAGVFKRVSNNNEFATLGLASADKLELFCAVPIVGSEQGTVLTLRDGAAIWTYTLTWGRKSITQTMTIYYSNGIKAEPTEWRLETSSSITTSGSTFARSEDGNYDTFVIGTPASLNQPLGIMVWGDTAFGAMDQFGSAALLVAPTEGAAQEYRLNSNKKWVRQSDMRVFEDRPVIIPPSATISVKIPTLRDFPMKVAGQTYSGGYYNVYDRTLLQAEATISSFYHQDKTAPLVSIPTSLDLVRRQMVTNFRGTLESGVPLPVSVNVASRHVSDDQYTKDFALVIEVRSAVLYRFGTNGPAGSGWTLTNETAPIACTAWTDTGRQALTGTYTVDSTNPSSPAKSLQIELGTPRQRGFNDGLVVWKTAGSNFPEHLRIVHSNGTYEQWSSGNTHPKGRFDTTAHFVTIGPDETMQYVNPTWYESNPLTMTVLKFEANSPTWSASTLTKTLRVVPEYLNGVCFPLRHPMADFSGSGWGQ